MVGQRKDHYPLFSVLTKLTKAPSMGGQHPLRRLGPQRACFAQAYRGAIVRTRAPSRASETPWYTLVPARCVSTREK